MDQVGRVVWESKASDGVDGGESQVGKLRRISRSKAAAIGGTGLQSTTHAIAKCQAYCVLVTIMILPYTTFELQIIGVEPPALHYYRDEVGCPQRRNLCCVC